MRPRVRGWCIPGFRGLHPGRTRQKCRARFLVGTPAGTAWYNLWIMSESDPPPQPPVSSEWDQAGLDAGGGGWEPSAAPGAGRAAALLWVCAAIQVLFFGGEVLALLQMPPEQWHDLMTRGGASLPTNDPALLRSAQVLVAILLAVITIAPGLLYAICAFGVRGGKRGAATVALWLAGIQFVVLGLLAAASVVTALRVGSGLALLENAGLWAVLLVPLALAIGALRRARHPGP